MLLKTVVPYVRNDIYLWEQSQFLTIFIISTIYFRFRSFQTFLQPMTAFFIIITTRKQEYAQMYETVGLPVE